MKPISIIQKLNESSFYYKEFGEGGEIDYIEFDTRQEAEDYAKKVNDETGHETAVYKMSNDECLSVYDEQYGMTGRPDPFAPTDEDWEDINHWYNDNHREEWDKKSNIKEGYEDDRKYRMDYEDDLIIIKKNGEVIDKGTVDDLKDNWNDFEDFTFDSKQKKYVCNHEGDTYTVEKVITEEVPAEHKPFVDSHKCPYCTGPMSDEEYKVFGMCRDCYDNGVE